MTIFTILNLINWSFIRIQKICFPVKSSALSKHLTYPIMWESWLRNAEKQMNTIFKSALQERSAVALCMLSIMNYLHKF